MLRSKLVVGIVCLLLAQGLSGLALAQEPPPEVAARLKSLEQQIERSRAEHEEIAQKARQLADELGRIRADMVGAARAAQESEELLSELEGQLEDLKAAEIDKSEALKRRSAQMTQVLTALLRLAWRPTEALLAQPQTPADTVRSAILLRAAVPRIEQSVKDLRTEIDMLARLRTDIGQQKLRIAATSTKLAGDHVRLKDLYERKAQFQSAAESERVAAEQRMDRLAGEAEDLRDLLARLEEEHQRRLAEAAAKAAAERAAREAEIAAKKAAHDAQIAAERAARDAEIAAKRAEKEQRERETAEAEAAHRADMQAQQAAREKEIAAQKATRDAEEAARQAAAAKPVVAERPISLAQGKMTFPARGRVVQQFGHVGEDGTVLKGIAIETRHDAQVVAPYDGQVAFAGPFRGYGLLLIIEHGEGYHTLLAGMARIDIGVGQRLLAGEPVGVMGQQDDVKPTLYVELRRNGQPINPLPWLSAHKSKVGG